MSARGLDTSIRYVQNIERSRAAACPSGALIAEAINEQLGEI